jgi:hypothetical protein
MLEKYMDVHGSPSREYIVQRVKGSSGVPFPRVASVCFTANPLGGWGGVGWVVNATPLWAELAEGGCMAAFRWNGGGSWQGKPWTTELPTDSQVLQVTSLCVGLLTGSSCVVVVVVCSSIAHTYIHIYIYIYKKS